MTTIHAPRFLQSELPLLPARECRFQVIPVPYEASVSYGGGTKNGPAALLAASCQLEVWTGRSRPSAQGIYTWPFVDCSGQPEEVLGRIEAAVDAALDATLDAGPQGDPSKALSAALPFPVPPQDLPLLCLGAPALPVILGGEHTVTLGALRALKKRYGPFGVIQFDAHADLRDTYEGSPYSHACVMRRAVEDLALPLFQVGVRSLSPEEIEVRRRKGISHLDARAARFPLARPSIMNSPDTSPLLLPEASPLPEDFPHKVFLTFDIDALDASLMPATGTPEPGGLFWWDALSLIERCLAGRRTLGFDVVELAPLPHMHAPTYTAARLTHEIMGIIAPE